MEQVLLERMQAHAEKTGLSMSEIANRAIHKHLLKIELQEAGERMNADGTTEWINSVMDHYRHPKAV
jgi:hypothetical protein